MPKKWGPLSTKALGEPGILLGSRQGRRPPVSTERAVTAIRRSESPPFPPPQSTHPPTPPGAAAQVGLRQSRFPQRLDEEVGCNETEVTRNAHVFACRWEASQKPAIVRLVGTAKAVSMSRRPMPPSKPRSGGSALGCGHAVSRTCNPAKREPAPERRVPHTGPTKEESLQGCPALRTAGYGESETTSGLHWGQPDGNVWLKTSGQKTTTPERKVPPPQHPTLSEQGARVQKCVVAHGSTHVVKSASELLEEARRITGTRTGGQHMSPEDKQAKAGAPVRDSGSREGVEMLAITNALLRDSGSREDEEEIIVVPQNEGDDDAPSTAERVTKEPMESVLCVRYANTSKARLEPEHPLTDCAGS
ncbi:hypothetical protein AAFF_G00090530 [Aldrovandia affinis]|uniref:Uncharacterized protein n=1 Tax=Aldrovandia affinis TaxID=143900 RepID=A0AAD7WC94_9TELE|nr:hypothetical protein AAFF_G00090530 [Aldrovandia affinis]